MKDHSMFAYKKGGIRIHGLIYVDDLIITGSSIIAIKEFKEYLSTCFKMKDLIILRYFLGIEVARSPRMYLCQRKYSLDIISDTGLFGVKPVSFPLEQNQKLLLDKGSAMTEHYRHRRLIGHLIYLGKNVPGNELCHSCAFVVYA